LSIVPESLVWLLTTLSAAAIGFLGLGVLLLRWLPVGDGRALKGREAILAGVVLVVAALISVWMNPSYQTMLQTRTTRETMTLAENTRATRAAEMDKELVQIGKDRKAIDKEIKEKRDELTFEILGFSPEPKQVIKLLSELKGEKKASYDRGVKEINDYRKERTRDLVKEENRLRLEKKDLGPGRVVPTRNYWREYQPLLVSLVTGLFVFGFARLLAGRDEPGLPSAAPTASAQATLSRPPQASHPNAPLKGPGAGQGPSASLPST
jgi:hypothetical protein